ncbi:MAG: AMP-dependent synthetase and ligase, partial [Rhodospirillaceae bacterium]|nr:AMP-dependent synthetase and ligase [Rhodospirillaceae bacterium]
VLHPSVTYAAVIGVPNEDFGEEVKAVVQLEPGIPESAALAEDLIGFTRDKVASYMVPRSLDFTDALPRLPTGKLYKHKLREKYWPAKPR